MPLYLIATPIGNLGDFSERALAVLKSADVVAAEDTRHSRPLLDKAGFKGKLLSYHDHNEKQRCDELADYVREGKSVAVISDAGTPGIADPAYRIVKRCADEGFPISPIPGACALIAALTASGLPTDRFAFEGFLPPKEGKRQRTFERLKRDDRTLIFYESPHRILKALGSLLTVYGDITIVVAREITKMHESFYRGPVSEVRAKLEQEGPRGEFVLLYNLKSAGVVVTTEEPEDENEQEEEA